MATKSNNDGKIQIVEIGQSCLEVCVLGTSPLIFNRMTEKAKRELLMPKGRKTMADKAANLKHVPLDEFRASVYRHTHDNAPTRLRFPAPAFKGAMATAALDLPGAKKSEIGRLCWIDGHSVDIYGVPKLLISVVRSADINKTPDIRTRAIVENWCARVKIWYVQPKLNDMAIVNLLAASGVTCGIGDFRQEKGKGNYGQFTLVSEDDERMKQIMFAGGRAGQDRALQVAEPFDEESQEMLEWWKSEFMVRTGKEAAA
jgi:hypothetical protein